MKKDIVTKMCEDLLELSQILDEPFKSKTELYDEIGVPFTGVNIKDEETESPRPNSEDSIADNTQGS
jgi:hypothetical protein